MSAAVRTSAAVRKEARQRASCPAELGQAEKLTRQLTIAGKRGPRADRGWPGDHFSGGIALWIMWIRY